MASLQSLLYDVHSLINAPTQPAKFVSGKYGYYHYLCDGFDDVGWGCGYRTLQTICSWLYFNIVSNKKRFENEKVSDVPSIIDIQNALVKMQDKPLSFCNSKQWIGSFEVCICVDYFYNVLCKIHHVRNTESLSVVYDILSTHFDKFGSPVMMGGDSDAASKCILGICGKTAKDCYLLILDPHCKTKPNTESLLKDDWLAWRHVDSFVKSSFYNLCLPQCVSNKKCSLS